MNPPPSEKPKLESRKGVYLSLCYIPSILDIPSDEENIMVVTLVDDTAIY